MGFFRRRRRDSDEPESQARDAPPPAKPPAGRPVVRPPGKAPTRPQQRPPGAPGPGPPPLGTKPPSARVAPLTPSVPEPALPPPPLPERLPEPAVEARDHRGTYATCFVCRSTLEHGTCPKCRMTWVE